MFNPLKFNKPKDATIDLQFGGFYVIKAEDGFSVIRLLDLPGDSYHYQMIGSTFAEIPTFEQVETIKPFILHIPMEIADLIGKDINLIGHRILSQDDLYGYAVYLKNMGVEDKNVNEHFEQLISLSANEPERMRLYIEDGEVRAEYL